MTEPRYRKSPSRLRREAQCAGRYVRLDVDWRACWYCGVACNVEGDHVPSLVESAKHSAEEWAGAGIRHWLVPACRTCNRLLWAHPLLTIEARVSYLLELSLRRVREGDELRRLMAAGERVDFPGADVAGLAVVLENAREHFERLRARWLSGPKPLRKSELASSGRSAAGAPRLPKAR